MAEFSKQFVEITDMFPEGDYDFDFDEIFSELPNNTGTSIICEGFGIKYVCKDKEGKKYVKTFDTEPFISYEEFIENFEKEYNGKKKDTNGTR